MKQYHELRDYLSRNFIFIEGPDCSGKSTLISSLSLFLDLESFHAGGPINSIKDRDERIKLYKKGILIDRCCLISDPIYGIILRGKTFINDRRWLVEADPIFIFCKPKIETVMSNLRQSLKIKKDYKSKEHCQQVETHYIHLYGGYRNILHSFLSINLFRVFVYNYEEETAKEFINRMHSQLIERENFKCAD
jgi:AAA15 family ATPase/GTPase